MFKRAVMMLLWMMLITGVIYPLLVTLTAQLAMHEKANGSFIYVDGKPVGSKLIGQIFTSDKYFWGRPSAHDYDAMSSGGSNLGPISMELKTLVSGRRADLLKANGNISSEVVPEDLLFASGSGLDPHISLKAAFFQVFRIIKARGGEKDLDQKVSEMILSKAVKRRFGFIGAPCVNVLELNLALDELQGTHER